MADEEVVEPSSVEETSVGDTQEDKMNNLIAACEAVIETYKNSSDTMTKVIDTLNTRVTDMKNTQGASGGKYRRNRRTRRTRRTRRHRKAKRSRKTRT